MGTGKAYHGYNFGHFWKSVVLIIATKTIKFSTAKKKTWYLSRKTYKSEDLTQSLDNTKNAQSKKIDFVMNRNIFESDFLCSFYFNDAFKQREFGYLQI